MFFVSFDSLRLQPHARVSERREEDVKMHSQALRLSSRHAKGLTSPRPGGDVCRADVPGCQPRLVQTPAAIRPGRLERAAATWKNTMPCRLQALPSIGSDPVCRHLANPALGTNERSRVQRRPPQSRRYVCRARRTGRMQDVTTFRLQRDIFD